MRQTKKDDPHMNSGGTALLHVQDVGQFAISIPPQWNTPIAKPCVEKGICVQHQVPVIATGDAGGMGRTLLMPTAGSTGPNTVSQQFFVDRGQVEIFWPTDTSNGKIWYGAVYQTVTDLPTPGATITQVNPNTSQGATCNLHPPDPHGCSPTQANGTN